MKSENMNKILEYEIFNSVRRALRDVFDNKGLTDGIHEFTEQDDIERYSYDVWDILQASYKDLGGFKSYSKRSDMVEHAALVTVGVIDGDIVACAVYRDNLGGLKLNGCGTSKGRKEQKELLRSIIKDDIEFTEKYHWCEVSYPLEHWFKELGGNPVPAVIAHKVLHKPKKSIIEVCDYVHYKRLLNDQDDEYATKAIYGFKDKKVYDKIIKNIESYCGFKNHDDFKNYANGLPRITESIDYRDNHRIKKVAIAMEVVIQVGDTWDSGVRELTPRTYEYLKNSVEILKTRVGESARMHRLMRFGRFLLMNMSVMNCGEMPNPIVMPAL